MESKTSDQSTIATKQDSVIPKRKRGRPITVKEKTVATTVHLTEKQLQQLRELAYKQGCTMSEIIRNAIEGILKQ